MSTPPAADLLTWLALSIVAASAWAWIVAAGKAFRRDPLVAWSPRRPVPWAFIDLILLIGLWMLASMTVSALLRHYGWLDARLDDVASLTLDQRQAVIVGNMVVSLSLVSVGLPLIAFRCGAQLRDFGFSADHVLSDLRLGLIGFVMLAPPVYGLQGLLVYFWKPSQHPLMEMFKGTPDTAFFVVLFISAAVVAPLLEELIFRVVQQGFLEKWFSFRHPLRELFVGAAPYGGDLPIGWTNDREPSDGPPVPTPAEQVPLSIDANPYAAPQSTEPKPDSACAPSSSDQPELRGLVAWLPIAISSAVFALLHYSHGPDWIPLLILAAGMGYLYQRTHRLLPSLTVHALLNAFSMAALWVEVKKASP